MDQLTRKRQHRTGALIHRFRQSATDQAYRLFTLALAGQPEKGAMNRLRESTGYSAACHDGCWQQHLQQQAARKLQADLLDVRNTSTEPEYYDYYYGSDIRDKAIILYTLTLLKNEEQALPLLKEICDNFNNNSWYSTQSIAWGLFSYMKWTEMIPGDQNSPSKIKISLNGEKSEQTITVKTGLVKGSEDEQWK